MLDPEIRDALQRIIDYEKESERESGQPAFWDWQEVAVDWQVLKRLILGGFLKAIGGRHKVYCLKDRGKVEEMLKEEKTEEPEGRLEVPEDLFSPILGYDDLKELVRRSLVLDRPVHMLFVGPPATAKSLFLEEINRIRGSSYHLGSSTSRAGLTQFLLDARPKILLLDELDKMDREDYAVLLSLMESGKVVQTKYGRRDEEHMKVWVFASCNKLTGIPPENISRFRPFIFRFRDYNEEDYAKVVVAFLVQRENIPEELAKYIAEKLKGTTRDVRAARGIARLCRSKEEVDRYFETVMKYGGLLG